jgi:hypothetical protein
MADAAQKGRSHVCLDVNDSRAAPRASTSDAPHRARRAFARPPPRLSNSPAPPETHSPLATLLADSAREVGRDQRPLLWPVLPDQFHDLAVLLHQRNATHTRQRTGSSAGPPRLTAADRSRRATKHGSARAPPATSRTSANARNREASARPRTTVTRMQLRHRQHVFTHIVGPRSLDRSDPSCPIIREVGLGLHVSLIALSKLACETCSCFAHCEHGRCPSTCAERRARTPARSAGAPGRKAPLLKKMTRRGLTANCGS